MDLYSTYCCKETSDALLSASFTHIEHIKTVWLYNSQVYVDVCLAGPELFEIRPVVNSRLLGVVVVVQLKSGWPLCRPTNSVTAPEELSVLVQLWMSFSGWPLFWKT